MQHILIIGATRGLGLSLLKHYASLPSTIVYGTTRSLTPPLIKLDSASGKYGGEGTGTGKVVWVTGIDLMEENCAASLVNRLGSLGMGGGMVEGGIRGFDVVIITAGYFATESFASGPRWSDEVKMYTTSSIAVPFLVHGLHKSKHLVQGSKVVLVSSESGSITLRHEKEGGGNYAHHASKAALNMVGKLLSLDLKEEGVIISIVHPGFMRTEMTKGVGFDKYWDDGGAVTPDVAAESLVKWVEGLDMEKSGQYWAPRGPRDIGTADVTMGGDLPTPLQLPW